MNGESTKPIEVTTEAIRRDPKNVRIAPILWIKSP